MTIVCNCACGRTIRVRDELAGKRVRCPECQEPVTVAQPRRAPAADASDDEGFAGLDELVDMERRAKRGKPVALTCPGCGHTFKETIARADLDRLRRAHAAAEDEDFAEETFTLDVACPRCFADVDVGDALASAAAAPPAGEAKFRAYYERAIVAPQGFVSNKPLAPGWNATQSGLNLVYLAGVVWSFTMIAVAATVVAAGVIGLVVLLLASAAQIPLMMLLAWLVVLFSVAACVLTLRIVMVAAEDLVFHAAAFIGFGVLSAVAIWATQGVAGAVLFGVEALVLLIAGVLGFVGWIRCAAIPRESGVKWLAIAAAAMLLLSIGLYAVAIYTAGTQRAVLNEQPAAGRFAMAVILSYLLAVTAHFLFIYFLRGIPRFFNDQRLFDDATRYLVFQFVVTLVGLVLSVMMAARLVTGGWAAFLALTLAVCGIVSVTWFLRLVAGCRDGIRPFFRT
ncbi:MAG TPA: hypothetical protein VML55_03310 [Planctomycetaceae bacterium]|nr:hypothetical protein [Planctomycetaceae bacterium]